MPDGVEPDHAPPAPPVHGDPLEGLRRLGWRHAGHDSTDGPGRRRAAHRSRSRFRRRWPRRILVSANIVTALGLIIGASAYGYVQWRLGQIKKVHIVGLHPTGRSAQSQSAGSSIPPFTLLAIGSDTRALGAASSSQFGSSSQVGGARSDSIILVRVVPKTRSLALLSIPRDTLVPIPGMGTTRINAAFNAGTASLLVTVLDQDFGIQVNHVVEFDFATFEQIANAVGGVEQYFPTPARDNFSLLNIPSAGCYNLTGAQALAFARSREYQYYLNGSWHYQLFPESDLARIQRQQSFTRDLLRKARKVAPTNLPELNAIIGSITPNLTVDSGFSTSTMVSLAENFRSASLSDIPSYTFPAVNSTSVPGALDPQMQQGRQVIQEWLHVGQAPAAPATTTTATATTRAHRTTTTAPAATTTLPPGGISVEVVNGSGVAAQAGRAAQDLRSVGYKVTVGGDSTTSGLATTRIQYAPDSLAAARQLQSELQGGATLVEDRSLTPTPFNLEVVTGYSYAGVVPGTSATTSTTVATSTTTTTIASPAYDGTATVNPDSSSFYHGLYVPPGLEPGQVPQTCGE